MATRPGRMNERCTFQVYADTPDGGGGTTKDWINLATNPTVWCEVTAKAGREAVVSDRITATMTTLFVIRNRSDLDETMRVSWRGSFFNITGIRREGNRGQYLTIEATRGAAL